jgi:hypothetical protein
LVNNILLGSVSGLEVHGASTEVIVVTNDLLPAACAVQDAEGTCVAGAAAVNAADWPGCGGASGNITEDPGFVAASDYLLDTGSPCIDTGFADAPFLEVFHTDLDRGPRLEGAGFDIGADERDE